MVCCSIKRNGKIYYKNVSDNWWNVYLNRARFENLPVKWISDVEYQITVQITIAIVNTGVARMNKIIMKTAKNMKILTMNEVEKYRES